MGVSWGGAGSGSVIGGSDFDPSPIDAPPVNGASGCAEGIGNSWSVLLLALNRLLVTLSLMGVDAARLLPASSWSSPTEEVSGACVPPPVAVVVDGAVIRVAAVVGVAVAVVTFH